MTTAELTERYLLGNYARFPLAFSRGEGSRIWTEDGDEYLDFATGIAVCALGHCPPAMSEAIAEQARRLIHCSNLYHIREQAELARFVVETILERAGRVFFCNSGAEANDALIKLARKRAYDRAGATASRGGQVVTCQRSFHGRTLGGIAATGQEKVKIGFDPLLPGFLHVPFNDPETLREAVGPETVAILLEPVQGEGGIHVATPDYLATAAALRDEFDCLLLFDEVQCGAGRTGDWCGWRTVLRDSGQSIEPDAVSWAKGLGGGFPIGAIWVAEEHAGALGPGTHGSTFGGTPLASVAALAVLEEIERDGVLENVRQQEQRIRERVDTWRSPVITGLRGLGLMLGFGVNGDALSDTPGFRDGGKTPALFVVEKLIDRRLLAVPAGSDTVRWLPPLNVTAEEVDSALDRFEAVLAECS